MPQTLDMSFENAIVYVASYYHDDGECQSVYEQEYNIQHLWQDGTTLRFWSPMKKQHHRTPVNPRDVN